MTTSDVIPHPRGTECTSDASSLALEKGLPVGQIATFTSHIFLTTGE